jgi:hypothetical protein
VGKKKKEVEVYVVVIVAKRVDKVRLRYLQAISYAKWTTATASKEYEGDGDLKSPTHDVLIK